MNKTALRASPSLSPDMVVDDPRHHARRQAETIAYCRLGHAFGKTSNLSRDLDSQLCGRFPPDVLRKGNGLKMIRIDTRSVSTEVVDGQAVRDGPDMLLVEDPSSSGGFAINVDVRVPMSALALPDPARRGVSAILNQIQGAGLAPAYTLMPANEPLRGAPDIASSTVGLSRRGSLPAATTHTQTGGIGTFALGGQLDGRDALGTSRASQNSLAATRDRTATIGAFSSRLGTHFWSLLHRFRGVVPRAAINSAGAFAYANYTAVAG